jgi:hypothetical protein
MSSFSNIIDAQLHAKLSTKHCRPDNITHLFCEEETEERVIKNAIDKSNRTYSDNSFHIFDVTGIEKKRALIDLSCSVFPRPLTQPLYNIMKTTEEISNLCYNRNSALINAIEETLVKWNKNTEEDEVNISKINDYLLSISNDLEKTQLDSEVIDQFTKVLTKLGNASLNLYKDISPLIFDVLLENAETASQELHKLLTLVSPNANFEHSDVVPYKYKSLLNQLFLLTHGYLPNKANNVFTPDGNLNFGVVTNRIVEYSNDTNCQGCSVAFERGLEPSQVPNKTISVVKKAWLKIVRNCRDICTSRLGVELDNGKSDASLCYCNALLCYQCALSPFLDKKRDENCPICPLCEGIYCISDIKFCQIRPLATKPTMNKKRKAHEPPKQIEDDEIIDSDDEHDRSGKTLLLVDRLIPKEKSNPVLLIDKLIPKDKPNPTVPTFQLQNSPPSTQKNSSQNNQNIIMNLRKKHKGSP